MVFQDGNEFQNPKGSYRIPIVFDNLIHRGEMPVTIGVFINPGVLPSANKNTPARSNRSFEYDAVTGDYARFLLEEILPEVAKKYNIADDPNRRAIGGVSSGAICSFTVAWHRPDAFRRVLSFIGSFTNMRGGDAYTSLVRKTEPKPIRVFLQSGKKDLNNYAGSWYIANQHLMASFEYMGYDAKLVLGNDGHNSAHGASILPDALRWLWRDYPNRITTPRPPDNRQWATNIVKPDARLASRRRPHEATEGTGRRSRRQRVRRGRREPPHLQDCTRWNKGNASHAEQRTRRRNGYGRRRQSLHCSDRRAAHRHLLAKRYKGRGHDQGESDRPDSHEEWRHLLYGGRTQARLVY